jgi:hypothetical protein
MHDTASTILQLVNNPCVGLQGLSFGLWVWSSSWGGLRMRLPFKHFQEILNKNQMKFPVVYFATAG